MQEEVRIRKIIIHKDSLSPNAHVPAIMKGWIKSKRIADKENKQRTEILNVTSMGLTGSQ